ncbi:MAG TPA: bifunctional precorrin-2 dehydrogenase/sirohydrochlorin ferrochelatase [Gemmatimonadaceae bacterium]|nr:bifunctional precorrin-2 dehydrogenase/sirohydrochlorin ferrochelatase [Gemmatimonadaceae bacterium]
MSAYPIVLEGTALSVLVVGGGDVATRKVRALVDAGARVHVVAPVVSDEIAGLATTSDDLQITRAGYATEHVRDVTLVIAATDDPAVNAMVASDARQAGHLVNVVDRPELGDFITPAVHRRGDLVVAVTAGGVPNAAARIRDSIGRTIDGRYATAVHDLAALRRALITAGNRGRWAEAAAALVDEDFCERVESGAFAAEIAAWR